MSDIKVGDKVYLNPESEYAYDDEDQLPVGKMGEVIDIIGYETWIHVKWIGVNGRVLKNVYKYHDLLKVELKLKENKPLPVHKVGQNVSPKEVDGDILTGCGVIISVEENKYNVVYEVLTDFGNVVTLPKEDFDKLYRVSEEDVMISVEERIQIQMEKLTNMWIKLKEGEYNEQ